MRAALKVAGFFLAAFAVGPSQFSGTPHALLPQDDADLRTAIHSLAFIGNAQEELLRSAAAPADLVAFGKQLFFEARLSANGKISCATCHVPEKHFQDHKPVAQGLGATTRNTPALFNVGMAFWFFWDGRADTLAAQMQGPLENPFEHGVSRLKVLQVVSEYYRPAYESLFGALPKDILTKEISDAAAPLTSIEVGRDIAAYGLATMPSVWSVAKFLQQAQRQKLTPVQYFSLVTAFRSPIMPAWQEAFAQMPPSDQEKLQMFFFRIGIALEAFERSILSFDAPFDQFAARLPSEGSLTSAFGTGFGTKELAGLRIFMGPGKCHQCHFGPNFTDQQFHNIGLAELSDGAPDLGRAMGILRLRQDPFQCLGPYRSLREKYFAPLESCAELPYLDEKNVELVGAYKTPSLRNLAFTAPYMHDGRMKNLDEVLEHYNTLTAVPAIGHREESLKPLKLSAPEKEELKAFLLSLSAPQNL